MIGRLRAAAVGAAAAWGVPRRLEEDLADLTTVPALGPEAKRPADEPRFQLSLRSSHRTLGLLAAVPGGRWRNTCLYRSAAECLLLRRDGIAARLCLGVRKDPGDRSPGAVHDCDIRAHAWVEIGDAGKSASGPADAGLVRLAGRDGDVKPGPA